MMLLVSEQVLGLFLSNKYQHVLSENNVSDLYFLGSELKDVYKAVDYLKVRKENNDLILDGNVNTKVNVCNFLLNKEGKIIGSTSDIDIKDTIESFNLLYSDSFFQIENTKKTNHIECLPLLIKELFFLKGYSVDDFISNLHNVFNKRTNLLVIKNNELIISDEIDLFINKKKIFNLCNSLQIRFTNDIKVDIYNISKIIFGYEITDGIIKRKIISCDDLFISFFSLFLNEGTMIRDNMLQLQFFHLKKQFEISFKEIIFLLGKNIDILKLLKVLRFFGYESIIDIENRVFFIHIDSFLCLETIEEAKEEIFRVLHKSFDLGIKKLHKQSFFQFNKREISEFLLLNNMNEIQTLPFQNIGFPLINPMNKNQSCLRKTLLHGFKDKKESSFEISSVFDTYEGNLRSFQFIGMWEKNTSSIAISMILDILFFISSTNKLLFNKKNISLKLEDDIVTLYFENIILFRYLICLDFSFVEINLTIFDILKIRFNDLITSKLLLSHFMYNKTIDITYDSGKTAFSFWSSIIDVLSKSEKKIFLSSFSSEEKSTFTVRYFFYNESDYKKVKKNIDKR